MRCETARFDTKQAVSVDTSHHLHVSMPFRSRSDLRHPAAEDAPAGDQATRSTRSLRLRSQHENDGGASSAGPANADEVHEEGFVRRSVRERK